MHTRQTVERVTSNAACVLCFTGLAIALLVHGRGYAPPQASTASAYAQSVHIRDGAGPVGIGLAALTESRRTRAAARP
jgi:hypothetical protein